MASPYEGKKSSHDSYDASKHENWLSNSAGLGIYAHGRVHQHIGNLIYVGDLLHKRGHLDSDDVLKMEEQAQASFGDPLSAPSRLGELKALFLMPDMGNATGEGEIIAYYEGGVVSFDTFKSPRETQADGKGELTQRGWEFERLITHRLNTVSAVGRRAVAVMPRDHFFRSVYGLHFLALVLGDGTFRPENINTMAPELWPLLKQDDTSLLDGAACGFWVRGHRLFATTGLFDNPAFAALPMGRGFISINQATGFSEDITPRATSEGLWVPDHGMAGIHQFVELGIRPEKGNYGFLASDRDAGLYFATIDEDAEEDFRDGNWIPIEWSVETGCFYGDKDGQRKKLADGILEGKFSQCSNTVRVLVRTDERNDWAVWKEFKPCEKSKTAAEHFLRIENLGQPPASHREATWFQFRIEGIGYAEIHDLRYAVSDAGSNAGKNRCVAVGSCEKDPFLINLEPADTRWTV